MAIDLSAKKLIILDRDGVINVDSADFIKTVDEWQPLPGSLNAIKKMNDAGLFIAIATNQSGIARGLFSEDTLHAMHEKMMSLLKDIGGKIDFITYCPHGPDDNCDCRKPKPGMMHECLAHFDVPAEEAIVVGDSLRDLQAAAAADIDSVLVKTGKGEKTLADNTIANPVYTTLLGFSNSFLCY